MTPKEKAVDLVNKFLNEQNNSDEISLQTKYERY